MCYRRTRMAHSGRKLMQGNAAIVFMVCVLSGYQYSMAFTDDSMRPEERSVSGFALINPPYNSRFRQTYPDCLVLCIEDPQCMSLNFRWETRICELNNKTRNSCQACFVQQPSSTYMAMTREEALAKSNIAKSCSELKRLDPTAQSGNYVIDPDGEDGLPPFNVTCDMTDENGVGVTVISHDSENRTLVDGYRDPGSYSRDINYTGASLSQLANLTTVSSHCKQFIKYECYHSRILRDGMAWWVSRNSSKMTYWGGALPESGKCACGMNNSCADPRYDCNCDKNDNEWREDSGLLTEKTRLPVKQLRFGDNGYSPSDQGYHTLGKFKCYGVIV